MMNDGYMIQHKTSCYILVYLQGQHVKQIHNQSHLATVAMGQSGKTSLWSTPDFSGGFSCESFNFDCVNYYRINSLCLGRFLLVVYLDCFYLLSHNILMFYFDHLTSTSNEVLRSSWGKHMQNLIQNTGNRTGGDQHTETQQGHAFTSKTYHRVCN